MLRRCSPLFVLALLLGASAPALADIPPETAEPEKPKKEKKGNCSVDDSSDPDVASLAALALLISAAALRRRR